MVRALKCWLAFSLPVILPPLPLSMKWPVGSPTRVAQWLALLNNSVYILTMYVPYFVLSSNREGPRYVAKFSQGGCTLYSANSTYHC